MPGAISYADLEIAFRKRGEKKYALSFRFQAPNDEAEQRPDHDPEITFDPSSIRDVDGLEYGRKLGAAIFTTDVAKCFAVYQALAGETPLRVRISIETSAPELHGVHWETLCDPARATALPLFQDQKAVFSRFLPGGQDSRPVRLRPKNDLQALVVIANPKNLQDFGMVPVNVATELATVQDILGPKIRVHPLAPGGPVPLNDLIAELSGEEDYDILYLVCHGQVLDDEPFLYMDETPAPAPGAELARRIASLQHRPRLVVLLSCQSAGKGDAGLAGLGPLLADAGVPAVIAMQGNIYMDTAHEFMKRFFEALIVDGQIDRAMCVARAATAGFGDWWRPALFMRLRFGRLWYEPGFEPDGGEFDWDAICQNVVDGQFVPILGPDIAEDVFGLTRTLAGDLARSEKYPLDSRDYQDLARVSQYLASKGVKYARDKVSAAYDRQLEESAKRLAGSGANKNNDEDDDEDKDQRDAARRQQFLQTIAANAAKFDGDPRRRDPLRILAGFKAKVIVNAGADTLFEWHLKEPQANGKTKEPVPLTVNWRDERQSEQSTQGPLAPGTVRKPYLYYVFGKRETSDDQRKTWVLTEDDFFDYTIKSTQYKLMPSVVGEALTSGSLLFLGFPLDDWKFRVLFRMILAKGGSALLTDGEFRHVGVQVDPGQASIENVHKAREYLQKYFAPSKIDIYWGTAADFLRQLRQEIDKRAAG